MKSEIKYIELKSGFSDNGPAWIGLVSYSKSGKTIYFNDHAFKSLNGNGISGNFYDLETSDEYWISGVKKDLSDRHWAGGGKVFLEERVAINYLQLVGKSEIDKSKFELVKVIENIPKNYFFELENERFETKDFDSDLRFKNPKELNTGELEFVINEYLIMDQEAKFNKARRSFKERRIEFQDELAKRRVS